MRKQGLTVHQAPDDADIHIINTAIQLSASSAYVAVVGEDVDLVLLTALTPGNRNIFLFKPGKSNTRNRLYSSTKLKATHKDIKDHILFLQAASGCDTTSSMYQKGKKYF